MVNPYSFTDRNLKIGLKINLVSHNNNHANSLLTISSICTDFRIKTSYINKNLKELATIYAGLITQNMCKNNKLISAIFFKINEEDQSSDENELFFNLNNNHSLTESDVNNIDVKSQWDNQIQF